MPESSRAAMFPAGAAVVIGGSGGLGREIAGTFAREGSDVALTFRANEAAGREAGRTVEAAGRTAVVRRLAIEDAGAVKEFVDEVAAALGAVHTLVYASGPDIGQPYISEVTPEQWRRVMDADANGFFNLVHAGLPHLRHSRGSLVAVTTTATHRYPPRDGLSAVPKAAVEQLVRAVAKEEGRFGVRANCVAPGMIEAGLGQRMLEQHFAPDVIELMRRNAALRRFGTAVEIAEVVIFLASLKAGYVTGQTVAVDGGFQL